MKFLDELAYSVYIINDELQLQCLFILMMHLQSITSFQQIFENSNQICLYFPWINLYCMTSDFLLRNFLLKIVIIMMRTLCGISFMKKPENYSFPYDIKYFPLSALLYVNLTMWKFSVIPHVLRQP